MATVFVFEMKNVFYQKKFVAFKKDILNWKKNGIVLIFL